MSRHELTHSSKTGSIDATEASEVYILFNRNSADMFHIVNNNYQTTPMEILQINCWLASILDIEVLTTLI
jgi:hypothetical protein